MKILNEHGKELSREEVIRSGYGHLYDDAPYLVCSVCGRKTWDLESESDVCQMPDPQGIRCQGTFCKI